MDINDYLLKQTVKEIEDFLKSLGFSFESRPYLNETYFRLDQENKFSLLITIDLDFNDISFDLQTNTISDEIYETLDIHPFVLAEVKTKLKTYESNMWIQFTSEDYKLLMGDQ